MTRDGQKQLRCGIIGAGNIAWRYDGGRYDGKRSTTHASCFDRHPKCELTAIYDPVEDALLQSRNALGGTDSDVGFYDNLDHFFECGLDLVSICSPSSEHVHHAKLCIDRHVPYIWLEKPVALELSAHRELLRHLKDTSQSPRISVNYPRRDLPQYRQLKEKIASGKMPVGMEINYSRGIDVNGVHMFDIAGYLLDLKEAPELGWCTKPEPDNPDFGFVVGRTTVTVTGYDLPYHLIEVRLIFDDGRVTIGRGGLYSIDEPAQENPDYPGFYHLSVPEETMKEDEARGHLADGTYRNLCNLVDDGTPLISDVETAYFAQAMLQRVMDYRKP